MMVGELLSLRRVSKSDDTLKANNEEYAFDDVWRGGASALVRLTDTARLAISPQYNGTIRRNK